MSTVPPEHGEFVATETRPVLDPQDEDLLKQADTEVKRYRNMDRLIPSFHNIVTVATIEVRGSELYMSTPLTFSPSFS